MPKEAVYAPKFKTGLSPCVIATSLKNGNGKISPNLPAKPGVSEQGVKFYSYQRVTYSTKLFFIKTNLFISMSIGREVLPE